MDQNQPFGSAPGGSVGGQVPPPPQTPEVKLRTMESDVSSIEKTGGIAPTPEFVPSPVFKPEIKETPAGALTPTRRWLVWVIVLGVILAVLLIVYFVVWPLIFPKEVVVPVVTPEPTPAPTPPSPAPTPPSAPPSITHQSVFGFSNDIIPKLKISEYGIVPILSVLQNEANNPAQSGELREVLIIDANDQPVTFSKYMATLMPELITSDLETTLKSIFEEDFTTYIYFDDKGAWPGYVVNVKPGTEMDVVTIQEALQGLESASYNNLFLTVPGNAQEFRTGTIKNVYTNRFVPLSQPGASFNYGLFDKRLIINTSYGGLLKTLDLMGL